MSQENVEIVRRVYEALARGDAAHILAAYDPEVEFRFYPGTLADRIGGRFEYHGHAGLREIDSELRDAFTGFETNAEDLIDAGGQIVLVSRYRGRGTSALTRGGCRRQTRLAELGAIGQKHAQTTARSHRGAACAPVP